MDKTPKFVICLAVAFGVFVYWLVIMLGEFITKDVHPGYHPMAGIYIIGGPFIAVIAGALVVDIFWMFKKDRLNDKDAK